MRSICSLHYNITRKEKHSLDCANSLKSISNVHTSKRRKAEVTVPALLTRKKHRPRSRASNRLQATVY